ncbi:unnamed protein product [Closterium sp. NIES-53]
MSCPHGHPCEYHTGRSHYPHPPHAEPTTREAAGASESRSDATAAGPDHHQGLHAEVQTDHHWSHRLHCRHSLRCLHRRHQSLHLRHRSHHRHHLHRLRLLYRCPHCHAHCHLHHHRCLLHYPGHPCPCCCGASY